MNGLADGQLRLKHDRIKSVLLGVIVFVVVGFFMWGFWCLSRDPCFSLNERECIEYGNEQDRLNPHVSQLNFSFLISPGKLIYPWISTYKQEEGSVVLSIEIDSSGDIISNKIRESSGFDRLDSAAIKSLSTFEVDVEKLNTKDFPMEKSIKLTFKPN